MTDKLRRSQSLPQQELERQLNLLADLEIQLQERELELISLTTELHCFEQAYFQVVGQRYAQLDQIEAELAQQLTDLHPNDLRLRQRAQEARAKAQESEQATRETPVSAPIHFRSSETLKKLYREVAKRIHPDLVTDPGERDRRLSLMIEANRAYEHGNTEVLEAILQGWEDLDTWQQNATPDARLLQTRRQIEQIQLRLIAIASEMQALQNSPLAELCEQAQSAKIQGRDLLAELAFQLEEEIAAAQRHLHEIKAK